MATLKQRWQQVTEQTRITPRSFRKEIEACMDMAQLDELLNDPRTQDYVRMWAMDRKRVFEAGSDQSELNELLWAKGKQNGTLSSR